LREPFFHADLKRKNTLIQPNRSAEFFRGNLRETLVAFDPKNLRGLGDRKGWRPQRFFYFKRALKSTFICFIDQ
jgi:hypothetical protein